MILTQTSRSVLYDCNLSVGDLGGVNRLVQVEMVEEERRFDFSHITTEPPSHLDLNDLIRDLPFDFSLPQKNKDTQSYKFSLRRFIRRYLVTSSVVGVLLIRRDR